MPITILKVHESQISPEDVGKLEEVCREISLRAHEDLHVPDENDREIRVVIMRGEYDEPVPKGISVEIAYTEGPNEYPKASPPSFFKNPAVRKLTAIHALRVLQEHGLPIDKALVVGHRQSTFRMRDGTPDNEEVDEGARISGTSPVWEESRIFSPRIGLFITREMLNRASTHLETASGSPEQLWNTSVERIARRVGEVLNMPEMVEASLTVIEGSSDTGDISDVSVEFDCLSRMGMRFSEEERELLARVVMQELDQDSLSSDCGAEVWIRQGCAEAEYAFAEDLRDTYLTPRTSSLERPPIDPDGSWYS